MRCSAALLVLVLSLPARADTTATVTLSPEGMMLARAIGISPAELSAQIKTRVDDAYRPGASSAPNNFMVGLAANLALAGR